MKEMQINKQLPVITLNFEEVKRSIQETMKKYDGIIVTEERLKDCKATQKNLAGLRNDIDGYRKAIKKEMEAPIKEFEGKCKELISLISDVEKPIKDGIKIYDDKRREEKRSKALEYIKESIEAHNLNGKYAARLDVKDRYLTLSGSLKSIKDDIELRAAALEKEQEDEKQRMEMLKISIQNAIDNANKDINTKLRYEDFSKYIEFGWSLDKILKEINDRAVMIREAEKQKEVVVPIENVDEVKQESAKEIKQNKERYYVDIYVEHSLEDIQRLSKFLKDNGYKYKVNKKGKVK
ncbi:DUF1351 domain-containing protein [Clostridium baratii]|uniref:DUF1351 domain-containing protein n=1 Tax=Clostridium baratii TaxID=1561 RepID=UPI0006BB31A3|nr:DUF1351 domain-containing protein [Clostridium baratii]